MNLILAKMLKNELLESRKWDEVGLESHLVQRGQSEKQNEGKKQQCSGCSMDPALQHED